MNLLSFPRQAGLVRYAFLFLLCFTDLSALSGCEQNDDAVTQWAADVRAMQRRVGEAERDEDFARAEHELRLLTGARPSVDVALVRPVQQDAYYQLARLSLRQEQPGAARGYADEGLALGRGSTQVPNVFAASLLVVRGQAHEALGAAQEAAQDYHEALLINERLLDLALEEDSL